MEQIYALYYEYADERRYFYVGRTGRDPAIRKREHLSKSKTGTEDVYRFIREKLQPNGCEVWDMEIMPTDGTGSFEDCEDFWVVLMIRAGHELKNMKHGDTQKIAALMDLARAPGDFDSVEKFTKFRRQVEEENYARSQRLRELVTGMTPSPRGDLQEILEAAKIRFDANDERARQQRIKREARDRARAIERQEWLGSLRNLFDVDKK